MGSGTQLWSSALLFTCCLLGRLWGITPLLACKDVLIGHPFRWLPGVPLGRERRVGRKELLQGDKARTWGDGTRDGMTPKDELPNLQKPILLHWAGFPKIQPGASSLVSRGYTSPHPPRAGASLQLWVVPGKPWVGWGKNSKGRRGEQADSHRRPPFQPTRPHLGCPTWAEQSPRVRLTGKRR